MKALKLSALLLGAMLLLGLGGATTLSAESIPEITIKGKSLNLKDCQGASGCTCTDCECDSKTTKTCKCAKCSCSSKKTTMKCGSGKCAGAKAKPKRAMKCGTAKCGKN